MPKKKEKHPSREMRKNLSLLIVFALVAIFIGGVVAYFLVTKGTDQESAYGLPGSPIPGMIYVSFKKDISSNEANAFLRKFNLSTVQHEALHSKVSFIVRPGWNNVAENRQSDARSPEYKQLLDSVYSMVADMHDQGFTQTCKVRTPSAIVTECDFKDDLSENGVDGILSQYGKKYNLVLDEHKALFLEGVRIEVENNTEEAWVQRMGSQSEVAKASRGIMPIPLP